MVKILLLIGALCSVTVTRTDGAVTLPQQSLKVQQGRTVKFACVVAGETFISWTTPAKDPRPGVPAIPSVPIRVGETVGRRSVTQNGDTYELTVNDVTVEDGGIYICQGSVNRADFTLQVDFDTGKVEARQLIHLNRKGIINLGVSAYPPLSYDWRKGGQKLTFPAAGRSLDPYTGSITIDNVQKGDEGNYTCTVQFGTSDTVHIEVIVIDEPKINKYQGDPVYRRLTQGYNVTFNCVVNSGYPEPKLTWWFDWSGQEKEVEVIHYPRYTHQTPSSWTITNILPEDKGKYRCIATNVAGEDDLRFEITQVDIPPVIDPMTDTIANDGDRVELVCSVAGTPTPTVEWYYAGSYYNGQTSVQSGQKTEASIVFSSVHLINTGKYTCRARNGARDLNADRVIVLEKAVHLYVRSMPKINKVASPTPVYSFVGRRTPVTVTCDFYGYPVPMVKMFAENGTEVASGNQSASITRTTSSTDDFGKFNCTASNSYGRAEYLVELKLAVPPGPPRNVAANKTCNAIVLMWQPPLENGGMPIINYIITVIFDGYMIFTENVAGSEVMRNIGYKFQPEKTYKVQLQARSEPGQGKPEALFVTTDKYCVPGKPTITNKESEVDVEQFIVTWTAPLDNGGDNNTKYRLEWRKIPITSDTEVGKEENIGETRFKITGLDYSSEYEVKLFAVNRQGDSVPDVRTFKTKAQPATPSDPPSKTPSSVKVSEFQTTVPLEPEVGARTQPGLGAGAIAGIVVAVILIVLITIDLFCCFFNSCGIIFCCHQAFCGGGGKGVKAGKDDYKDGKASEMEKQPALPEKV